MKKVNKRGKVLIAILFIIVVIVIILLVRPKEKEKVADEGKKVISNITSYGYSLNEEHSDYYKELYNNLEILLNSDNFSKEEYASLISQMFATDFYTLSNKTTNSDIGGLEFIYSDIRDNFVLKSSDTIYKYVQNNFDGSREQDLPEVIKVIVQEVKPVSYTYNNITDSSAYEVSVKIEYEVNYGYPTSVKLLLINDDNKLSIVEIE